MIFEEQSSEMVDSRNEGSPRKIGYDTLNDGDHSLFDLQEGLPENYP